MICRTTCIFLSLTFLYQIASGSFCGPAAIPFSFESLLNGQPVLGCARPKCFGWTSNSKPAGSPSTFFRVHNKPDGYFRKSIDSVPTEIPEQNARYYKPQVSVCSSSYDSEHCDSENQWLGGISPLVNVSGLPLAVQCCEYEPLRNSTDRGIAVVNPGQIVIGGEILNNDRLHAFDYISDISKHTKSDGTVYYEVAVRRLACIPHPSEFSVDVDQPVISEIVKRFAKTERKIRLGDTKALQAPTQTVSEQTELQEIGTSEQVVNVDIQQPAAGQPQIVSQTDEIVLSPTGQETTEVIQGPFVAEQDAIVEEVDAIPGFELPPGQVPQGLIEPVAQPAAPSYSTGGYAGGGGSSHFCFSADTTVSMSGGKTKRMDELNVGDWILSGNNNKITYVNIESWIHKMPGVTTNFHRIELTDGKVLKITSKHYIYKTECTDENNLVTFKKLKQVPVYADKVQVGDCLYVVSDTKSNSFEQRRVQKIDIVEDTGVYAPMTSNGDIIVNGIRASCYNILNHRTLHNSAIKNLRDLLPSIGWIFGDDNEIEDEATDLPHGTNFIVEFMEYVLPTSVYKM